MKRAEQKLFHRFLIIFAIIFWIAAIGYSLYLGNTLRYPDERWYFNEYAQNIAKLRMFSQDGVSPTAFHPPVYPMLLGSLVMLKQGVIAARLFNFLILFVTWLSLFFWLKKRSPGLTPLFTILLALGYPVLFYTAGTLYPQTLGAFFFVIAIIFFWQEPFKLPHAVLSGLSMGLGILTISSFLFIPFFMLMFTLVLRRKYFRNTVLLLVVTLITLAPWTIRNYLVFHRFVPLSTNFGINFLIGNNPSTTPNSGVNVDLRSVLEEVSKRNLDEFEANRFYIQKAIEFIQSNPAHYLSLYFLKVLNYFNIRNELATASEASAWKDLLMAVTYGVLILLTLARLVLSFHFPIEKDEIFMFSLYLTSAFVHALFFTRIRFRLPFDYLLIVLASIFLGKLAMKSRLKDIFS